MALTEAEELELLELEEQEAMASQPQQNQPQPSSGFMDTMKNKAIDFATDIATPRMAYEKYGSILPVAGAVAGGPIGAGLGAIAKNAVGIAVGDPNAPTTPWEAAKEPMLQAGFVGAAELPQVGAAIQGAANNLGRRALGFTKGMIKRTPGGVNTLNKTAETMLDKGVIKFGAGAEATLERAREVASKSGKAVGNALSKAGDKAINTQTVADEVVKQLSPKYSGGAYDAEKGIVEEIKSTIMAHGDGPAGFGSAQDLKSKLGDLAKFNRLSDATKSNLYRRAYGIVSDAIESGLGQAKASALPGYIANKATYGASQRAIEGLSDKVAGEASNSLLSLRGAAVGAGALASGNVGTALQAMGTWEAARRIGSGSGAAALNFINKSPAIATTRRALITQFIDNHSKGEVLR